MQQPELVRVRVEYKGQVIEGTTTIYIEDTMSDKAREAARKEAGERWMRVSCKVTVEAVNG